jgi:alkyl hydroperoxide reductase subunit AhpC
VVTSNNEIDAAKLPAKYSLDFEIICDKDLNVTNSLGINKWNSSSDASYIYIADKENKILYARADFKGEGEKLKNIQSELYSAFNLKENIASENTYPVLMPGDEARNFKFTAAGDLTADEMNLTDYKGKKNVLIAFYPAPFSMSCAYEVARFDTFAEEQLIQRINNSGMDDIELLMVSYSNSYILSKWKEEMGIKNVKLVNDYDGSISMKYNSYNPFGYSNRTVLY